MKKENVKAAIREAMARDIHWSKKALKESNVIGLEEVALALDLDLAELRAEAHAIAANPGKIGKLMADKRSDIKGRYAA